jgi:hypothetical protein
MAPPDEADAARRPSARGPVAAVTLLAALVASAATIFGFGFAPEAHHEEAEAEHAQAADAAGEQEEAEEGAAHAGEEEEEAEEATIAAITSAILISFAGVALVPLALLPAWRRRQRLGLAEEPRPGPALPVVRATSMLVALLSIGAAVVHFAVIAQHLDEWWLTGLFFVSIALFQLAWGLLVLIRPSARVYVVGALANALIVVTWIVSRTTGVPIGPEAGEAEAVGFPDALSTAFEIVLVALLAALVVGRRRAQEPTHRQFARAVAGWGAAAVVGSLTALALVILA